MDGICTLANDYVYDQLVALLNSIEVNQGKDTPVCIFPYDDNLERVRAEIAHRPNVQIYDDQESIDRWDTFAQAVWERHPTAKQQWNLQSGLHRAGTHRRFCGFDGPFDRFIYIDADALLIDSLDYIFEKLETHDWVVYDYQFKDPSHIYTLDAPQLYEVFPKERIETEIFCSGFYGTHRNLYNSQQLEDLLNHLGAGEAEVLYVWAPDQTILNYLAMRSQRQIYNFSLHLPPEERTGCCVTSPHFEETDGVVYDKGKRLTYLHYIGVSSSIFRRLCEGENLDCPYRDVFLHYRYLHEPEKRPQLTGTPKPLNPPPTVTQRLLRKLGLRSK
ncbi:sugar transferase [Geitlerinema sp. P-1104]|uniref:Npun_R2821/Npun_R2822 family protein n=1 Tax=Geitlerinema sp. P-1104 TaxID=2546230 RepID=UPI0014772B6D|nr:Npun_R2821/Npun_R2822 family protein [Geitlerinema sp. P-1104]NMG58049.1 sugar transferase [Geitlerinema sp. P-1104]